MLEVESKINIKVPLRKASRIRQQSRCPTDKAVPNRKTQQDKVQKLKDKSISSHQEIMSVMF